MAEEGKSNDDEPKLVYASECKLIDEYSGIINYPLLEFLSHVSIASLTTVGSLNNIENMADK